MALYNFNYAISRTQFRKFATTPDGQFYDAALASDFSVSNILLARKGHALVIADADVKIFVDTNRSYVLTSQMSEYLLKHEQLHYDITALAAREYYKKVFELIGKDEFTLHANMYKMRSSLQQIMIGTQRRYDHQTKHDIDKTAQEKWIRNVSTVKQTPNGRIDQLWL